MRLIRGRQPPGGAQWIAPTSWAAAALNQLPRGRLAVRVEAAKLTGRQREVLALLANGLHNNEIAAQLGVSEDTVKTHSRHLLAKLGASSRAHAIALAFCLELLRPSEIVRGAPRWARLEASRTSSTSRAERARPEESAQPAVPGLNSLAWGWFPIAQELAGDPSRTRDVPDALARR